MDNHNSDVSLGSLNLAKENEIMLLTLPLTVATQLNSLWCTKKKFYNAAAND